MFGQKDDRSDQDQLVIPDQAIDDVASNDTNDWQHPGTPLGSVSNDTDEAPADPEPTTSPSLPSNDNDSSAPVSPAAPSYAEAPATESSAADNSPHDLIDLKQQALTQLTPLVDHLDQSAEEKFRTTMMMIQASDDQSLLKAAFDAAQSIEDDKVRAQALLDIINEINYFTQQHKG
jgi:hypothetical protein